MTPEREGAMTEEQLGQLEALADAATPGPWAVDNDTDKRAMIATREAGPIAGMFRRDADFAAASREAVPALVAEVRRLRALVREAYAEGFEDGCFAERGENRFWHNSITFQALGAP